MRLVDLLAVVPRGGEVLAPALDPLARPRRSATAGAKQLLVVDGALRTDPPPTSGASTRHSLGRDAQDDGHHVSHHVRVLRGRPDDQVARLRIAEGEHPARLDGHGRRPRWPAPLFHQVGGGKGALGVADRAAHDHRGVGARPRRMRASRRRLRRDPGAGDRSRRGRRPSRRYGSSATTTATGSPTHPTTSWPARPARRAWCWACRRTAPGSRPRPRADRRPCKPRARPGWWRARRPSRRPGGARGREAPHDAQVRGVRPTEVVEVVPRPRRSGASSLRRGEAPIGLGLTRHRPSR